MDVRRCIELRNVEKSFGLYRNNRIAVLKGIDLDINEGEFVCIMGASGSGKTTLLNILSAIDRPTTGKVRIDDKNISAMSSYQLADFRFDHLGYVFQEFYLIEALEVYKNIAAALYVKNVDEKQIRERVETVAEFLDITMILDKKVEQCSRGQKQRVAIARALITNPKIIVADEPTGNLDQANAYQLLKFFQRLNKEKGVTIILVTHDFNVASYGERLLYLKDGLLQAELKKENMSKKEFLDQIKGLANQAL